MTWKKLRLGIGFIGLWVVRIALVVAIAAFVIFLVISTPPYIWIAAACVAMLYGVACCIGEYLEYKHPERFADSDTHAGLPDIDPPKR